MKNFTLLLSFLVCSYFASAQCSAVGGIVNNVSCNGACNGSAWVLAAGGTAPYSYLWVPAGATTQTAVGLCAGPYVCQVTDALGCTALTSVITITQPPQLIANASHTDASCYGGTNGSASVTASGGTNPYSYQWSPAGGTNATANNLGAGCYTCTVTDSHGCTAMTTACITEPTQISAAVCYETNVSCNGMCDGMAVVCPTGGTPAYSYQWIPSGGGNQTATNLCAGTYSVNVTDANGCSQSALVVITEPPVLTVNVQAVNSTSATVTAGGGTGSYTYSWTPSGQNGQTATNLSPGDYTCCVYDANGCSQCGTVFLTRIDEASQTESFSIHPNPSQGTFTISFDELKNENAELKIFDVMGRVVFATTLNTKSQTLNPNLSSGIYFVKMSDGERVWTQKLVIE
jgi:hypothetical protein